MALELVMLLVLVVVAVVGVPVVAVVAVVVVLVVVVIVLLLVTAPPNYFTPTYFNVMALPSLSTTRNTHLLYNFSFSPLVR